MCRLKQSFKVLELTQIVPPFGGSLKRFALMGAAGYIAPRHMQAVRDTGHVVVSAFDPNDSVGIMDSFFPDAHFFTEFERFDRQLDKLRRRGPEEAVNYISICSPNYLHDAHMRFALRAGADAICEKPLVLNPWNIDALIDFEKETGRKINTILQLRLHPAIKALREKVLRQPKGKKYDVELTYVTSRGRWYLQSWKGDVRKSGGIATNIGVHFFDMLHFVFGDIQESKVYVSEDMKAGGYLEYEHARVRWFLSLDVMDVPKELCDAGQRTFRAITADGEDIEFSKGFGDLHTESYREILNGNGFNLEDNRVAVETVAAIRTAVLSPLVGDYHPALRGQ
jgi:UDP-N-acetyl-2-amino-2-deoxyglucuronate dehydrogenase